MESAAQVIDHSILLIERGDFHLAVKQLTTAYENYPENDEILVLFTEALSEMGRTKQALDLLLKRSMAENVSDDVLFALGDEYFSVNDFGQAQSYYKQLLLHVDAAAEAWVRIGLISVAEGENDEAKSCFLKSLDLDDDTLSAINSLGDLALEADDLNEAKSWFHRALKVDGEDPEAASNLAEVYYDEGDLEQAKSFAQQAIQFDPCFAPAWLTLGYVAFDCDDEDQVRHCFKKFLELEHSEVAADIVVEVKAVLTALKDS
ncbi:MAG: hypothetical protein B6I37_06505 [Desulfobacteraceae bacterium 4572_35.2]|nr:MAG: hypothetical protein B6I37_06505 [Desulfobacteraceae bacterium 4572_35.2]